MIRFLKFIVPIILILFGAVAGSRYLDANKPEPETASEPPKAVTVFAERVEQRTLTYKITTQGEVRPRSEIGITPQVSGRVSFVTDRFIDGGYIAKDEIIARLDPTDFELSMVRAQAGVASAEQQVERERAESEIALRDLEELGISQSSPLARREPQMAEAQAMLASAKAQLQEAHLAMERSIIRAPFNLRVRTRSADVGQFVSPGQSLGTVFATDKVEVSLPITDDQLGQLGLPLAFSHSSRRPGPVVTFNANVGGEMRTWTGRIVRSAAVVNSQSRLINIVGEVNDPYGRGADKGTPMVPGLFVTATIKGRTVEDVLWAPRSAVRGNDQLYISVDAKPDQPTTTKTEDGELKRRRTDGKSALSIRAVDVLYSDQDGAYFTSGAEIGELAIISPIQTAVEGLRINVQERLPDGTIVDINSSAAVLTSSSVETAQ